MSNAGTGGNRRPIVGFATETGGRTSHVSIIAKSLFMPAVIGVPRLTKIVDNDETVIVEVQQPQ